MNKNLKRDKDIDRATLLEISGTNMNEYSITSSLTETHPISMEHNRRLVNEMIDSMFDERKGTCEMSSSQCSSLKLHLSDYSYDKRLKYWKDVLKDRQKISSKIAEQTKKNESDILYNRLGTVDERDKNTIKRLMDYAQRLNPTSLSTRQPAVLQEKCDTKISIFLPEIQETLPQIERRENVQMEISGLPKVVQQELLGQPKKQGNRKPSSWLKSKHLENCIAEKRHDVERVIEYYPDIENLEIVGKSLLNAEVKEHNPEIQIISCNEICQISSETEREIRQIQTEVKNNLKLIEYGFKINDQEFIIAKKHCSRNFKIFTNFSCFPFQTEIKKIFTLQNIGSKVLTFEWVHRSFYDKHSSLLKCCDNEFVFDNLPFRLCSREVKEIFVMYQPRRVNIAKSKWILKVKPTFFSRKIDGIIISFCGVCAAPPEYVQKLKNIQSEVIEKSNKKMVVELITGLISLVTDLQPWEFNCPYQRSLSEMELFEQLNFGFKCERYNDLESLKDLYKRAKKPREKMWDLQINTLKSTILNVPQAETRALMFNELSAILSSMKGLSVDLETKIFENPERNRSQLLFVKGIVVTAIEEWIDLITILEETFFKNYIISKEFDKPQVEEVKVNDENKNLLKISQDELENRQYILEKWIYKSKLYRDALYMQTYTLLCDFIENFVNVIESANVV